MRIYTFYRKPGETSLESAIAVPERFSIAAFLLGFIWALYRRLWLVAVMILGAQLALPGAVEVLGLNPALGSVALFAFAIYVGCSANDWRREKLERKGYAMVGIAAGRTLEEAERRFFDNVQVRPSPETPPKPPVLPRAFGTA